MIGLLFCGSIVSAFTTWILFLAVAQFKKNKSVALSESLLEANYDRTASEEASPSYTRQASFLQKVFGALLEIYPS